MAETIANYLPAAYAVAQRIMLQSGYLSATQKEDILADVRLAVLESVKTYDPGKGALGGFVKQVAFRKTWEYLYAHRFGTSVSKAEAAARAGVQVCSTDVHVGNTNNLLLVETLVDVKSAQGFERIFERDSIQRAETLFRALLSPFEFEVLWLYHVEGQPYIAIMRRTGKSYKSIDNAMQRAYKMLRRKLKPGTLSLTRAAKKTAKPKEARP